MDLIVEPFSHADSARIADQRRRAASARQRRAVFRRCGRRLGTTRVGHWNLVTYHSRAYQFINAS